MLSGSTSIYTETKKKDISMRTNVSFEVCELQKEMR
jgi:hypothetical protein